MFMTEQGAGSDIAATAVRAAPREDGTWRADRRQVVLLQRRRRHWRMVLARQRGRAGRA